MPTTQPCILVVEDEPVSREILVENLQESGYEVLEAENGSTAWQLIEAFPQRFSAILLDRMMPDIDGIEILRRLKMRPHMMHVPVIMQTAMGSESDVLDGLQAGAYYYLIKPFSAHTLLSIVAAASRDYQGYQALTERVHLQGRGLASSLIEGRFAFRSPEEVRQLVALVANAAPDPARVALGLSELMDNAIEHGNLAIGYAGKSALIERGMLSHEIGHRLTLPAYRDRVAELQVSRGERALHFLIRDQGTGFDWTPYLQMSPERVFDTHGRGIAMSAMLSFDQLEYRGCGNEVLATVNLSTDS
jgi:DNA-binding response OmpR family regulator